MKLQELVNKVASYETDADLSLLRKAYFFTMEAHCDQIRKEGIPYFDHPLSVAFILADMHLDYKAIIAGLLHDTVEDTIATIDDIKELFGNEVAFIVDGLTKLNRMELKSRKEIQAENFRKMFLAMADDVRVILIKFADRLHNMKTLQFLAPNKQRKISEETLEIYVPLANRLGIGWLKSEFEDLGFKYLYPEKYEEIAQKVAEKRVGKENYIKEIADILEKKLKQENITARVTGRVKNYYGIYQKMVEQRVTFDEVYDILGLRIITDTKANCYAALGLIHSLWIPVPGRFKDYIAMPKSNDYQSLHTTVLGPSKERVEFQIRTEQMHLTAENGIASHWMYKEKGKPIQENEAKQILWLRGLLHSNKESKNAREFLDIFKGENFNETVFVFTPAGEIKELPLGSTTVDFAYSIHTDIGNKCAGAKVNGRIMPLKYQLQNGDVIEIIKSQAHGPSKDWLNFVVTPKARNRIRHWIKSEQRKQGIELGSSMLEEEFKRNKHRLSKLRNKQLQDLALSFSFKNFEDLLMAIGYGKFSARQVYNKFKSFEGIELQETPVIEDKAASQKQTKHEANSKGIQITGIGSLVYTTAKCCYPVPGDEIMGFVTKGKGLTVHRTDCKNFQRLSLDDTRVVEITWDENNATSQGKLYVETIDKQGMLANLTAIISTLDINLSHFEARSDANKRAYFTFVFDVKNSEQIDTLYRKLLSSDGVIRVNR
ncbi:(p)ppGpp synthetase I SpoT/RelA [Candidatus Magnetoovum chiemensis]|nr:(p)ppGpp synthetase I SpoT/RelA [Candidatus Magnetoovum chiemensis]